MALEEKINQDLTTALKAKNTALAGTLRLLKAALKNASIEARGVLDDEGVLKVLRREARQRKDSIAEYEKGGREDLAAAEQAELALIESYLPASISEEEVEKLVVAALEPLGEITAKDFGRAMGEVMKALKGKAEGDVVQKIVRTKLGM